MLSIIQSRRYTFKHNLSSVLLCSVAISGRRCLLFYSNLHYYEYDPYLKQVINTGTLPCKPVKTLLLSKHLVLILLENGKLCRLQFEKGNMEIGCQLPTNQTKTDDVILDRQMVFDCDMSVFTQSSTYFISLLSKPHNKCFILYFSNPYSFQSTLHQFHSIEPICQKLDQQSKIVIYFQKVDEEIEWDMKIVDLKEGTDRRVVVYNELLKSGSMINRILMRNDNQIYMFVGGTNSTILILELQSQTMSQVKYKLLPNLIDILYYSPLKDTILLSYLYPTKLPNGQITDNILQVVDLTRGEMLSRVNVSLKECSMPIEKDYVLDVGVEGKEGKVSMFHGRYLIRKRAMVFHLMKVTGVFGRYGSGGVRRVLALLDV